MTVGHTHACWEKRLAAHSLCASPKVEARSAVSPGENHWTAEALVNFGLIILFGERERYSSASRSQAITCSPDDLWLC